MSDSYAAWIGRVIDGRYRLDRILGEGGMGAVFVAEHLRLHKEVAFKIIRPEIASDPQISARFAREAMATAQIESLHIASAVDYGELPEGGAFLVTQLARGRSLSRHLNEGPIPWPRAVEIAAQIADALATAHALGIIHRDLKPDNIIVGDRDDGTPLATVLDFGIASLSADAQLHPAAPNQPLTSYGLVLGTPGYMAPEQAVGDKVDVRTDLYALGIILWESIRGQLLWEGESLTEIVSRQMRAPAPSVRAGDGIELPEELDALIAALLARNPNERPESAAAVRSSLRALITLSPSELAASAALSLSAPGGLAWSSTAPGQATLPDRPAVTAPLGAATQLGAAPPAGRDRQVMILLAACVVLGAVALIGALTWMSRRDDPAADADAPAAAAGSDKKGNAAKAGAKKGDKPQRMSIHDDDEAADDDDDGGGEAVPVRDKKGRLRWIPR